MGGVHRRIPPRAATWLLTVLIALAGLGVAWAVALLAVGFVAQRHVPALELWWCTDIYGHAHVPWLVGVAAVALLVGMVGRALGAHQRYRHYLTLSGEPVEIVPSAAPMAVSLPGRPGRILISTGMLRSLEADEIHVVLAHEHAHIRHHHHLFLAVADVAASAVPVLRWTQNQIRHTTERWADETSAAQVGDRRLVARAIARAALASDHHGRTAGLGMATTGVAARVESLLGPRTSGGAASVAGLAVGLASFAVALVGSGVQLHHLVAFVGAIC